MGTYNCIWCGGTIHALAPDRIAEYKMKAILPDGVKRLGILDELEIDLCPKCGWWRLEHIFDDYTEKFKWWATFGVIKVFKTGSADIPIEMLRQQLLLKPNLRSDINPKKMEDLVSSVFKEAGFETQVTGYIKDGGLDVIMNGSDGSTVGVQVKRWRGKVTVKEIRELIGVLYMKGITKGMFVTTSDYTTDARREAEIACKVGIPVELLNWERFFDVMKINRIVGYNLADETCPFRNARVEHYTGFGSVPNLADYYKHRAKLPILR